MASRLTPVMGSTPLSGAACLVRGTGLGFGGTGVWRGATTRRGRAGTWQLPFADPSTASELPQTSIGIVTGMEIWLPLAKLPLPVVVPALLAELEALEAESFAAPLVELPAAAVAVPPEHWARPRPSAATAFPQMSTGTLTGKLIWLPLPTPPLPEVVPACAAP